MENVADEPVGTVPLYVRIAPGLAKAISERANAIGCTQSQLVRETLAAAMLEDVAPARPARPCGLCPDSN